MKPELHEIARREPKLSELLDDYRWCIEQRGQAVLTRIQTNHDARYNIWPGQSDDGRKWTPRAGEKEVRPWKGASDARPHLIDNYIIEDVARLMTIWRRNKILVTPTESNDNELAVRLTQLMRWLLYTQMKEAPREAKLAANRLLERPGGVVLCCWWLRQTQMGYEELDMETLQVRAMQAQQFAEAGGLPPGWTRQTLEDALNSPALVMDETREDTAIEAFGRYYPDVTKDAARRAVRDLREEGIARFPRPYLRINRPCVGARALNEEIFVPPEACDVTVEEAASVHEVELLTEAKLRERKISHGWDADWVDEVVETQRGNVDRSFTRTAATRWSTRTQGISRLPTERLFEIIHTCRRVADAQGVMQIEYTCWHAGMVARKSSRKKDQSYAYHGILNYDHGEYPYTLIQRERRSRIIDDARGYGEVALTWQNQVKSEWDQRIDAASLRTLPPYTYPVGMPPSAWGPGVGIETNRREQYGAITITEPNPGSLEIEKTIRDHADQYFGRVLEDKRNLIGATAIQQDLADEWMTGWGRVATQSLQLFQQFGPETIYYRVVGSDKARPMQTSREEIQGQFDVNVTFNVQQLDPEYVKMEFDLLDKAMQWDISGRVDRDEVVLMAFELVDPNAGERVLKPGQEAASAEIEDEANALSKMLSGIPVDIKLGQAYQLRLQWLMNTISKSQPIQKQLAEDEDVRELVERHAKQLNHQIEQHTVNAQIGRLGA